MNTTGEKKSVPSLGYTYGEEKMNTTEEKKSVQKKWLWGLAAGIVLLLVLFYPGSCLNTVTISEYQEHIEQKINKQLGDSRHELRKMVENAHLTVNVTNAYVSRCAAETKDGSNDAGGYSGKNIRKVSMNITTRWDGLLHKGGETIVGIELENVNGNVQITKAAIIKSDALININDPKFWYNVGFTLGMMIF